MDENLVTKKVYNDPKETETLPSEEYTVAFYNMSAKNGFYNLFNNKKTLGQIIYEELSKTENPMQMSANRSQRLIVNRIECDEQFIFGTIGIPHGKNNTEQYRDEHSLEVVPDSSTSIFVEEYTYFYMDLLTANIAAIEMRPASQTLSLLKAYVHQCASQDVHIVPIVAKDWQQRLKNINKISKSIAMMIFMPH